MVCNVYRKTHKYKKPALGRLRLEDCLFESVAGSPARCLAFGIEFLGGRLNKRLINRLKKIFSKQVS